MSFSGSTAVLTLIVNDLLYCYNIGDSRAVVCTQTKELTWKAKPLSVDHKADHPQEAQRILKNRGRLEPYRDENGEQMGPFRVWLQHEQLPGLAMTRSFGDAVASTVGVICDPEIITHRITKGTGKSNSADKFLILASDGLWEFISNEQAMEAIVPCFMRNDIEEAVR